MRVTIDRIYLGFCAVVFVVTVPGLPQALFFIEEKPDQVLYLISIILSLSSFAFRKIIREKIILTSSFVISIISLYEAICYFAYLLSLDNVGSGSYSSILVSLILFLVPAWTFVFYLRLFISNNKDENANDF